MPLFPRNLDVLERGLAAASLRHAVLAHNLANVNTPGYKAMRVSFEETLQAALAPETSPGGTAALPAPAVPLPLAVTDPRHLQVAGAAGTDPLAPTVTRDEGRSARADGNSVDLEAEMALLAANQLYYGALSRQLSDEFLRLRLAITEGRR